MRFGNSKKGVEARGYVYNSLPVARQSPILNHIVAPSPTIPTSFVPKQPVQSEGRSLRSGGNTFLVLAVILFVFALAAAGGVFAYERYLMTVRDGKRAEVEAAQSRINTAAVEDFILMRNRFSTSQALLDRHVAATQFFMLLENATLQNMRFDSLSFTLADDRSANIEVNGTARTFNALAAQSSALAQDRRIRRAIFSDITVNENGTVSFALSAELAPALLAVSGSAGEAQAPALPEVPAAAEPPVAPAGTSTTPAQPETPASDAPAASGASTSTPQL